MALPADLPIVDHHCHLSPRGEGVAAAHRFAEAGGTHLFLATQQYTDRTPRSVDEYRAQFETTEGLAKRISAETDLVVYPVIAPYPIDLLGQAEEMGLEPAQRLQESALELAGHWVEEGRAVALGEVGRPHFPVADDIRAASSALLRRAFEVCRDVGCPAILHSEDLDPAGFADIAALAGRCSFSPGRLVKHYARQVRAPTELSGVVPSYLARRDIASNACDQPAPWFLETDFLDDLRRPGAVLDIATVPRRAKAISERGPESRDRLYIPFVESVERVYGFRPVAPARKRA